MNTSASSTSKLFENAELRNWRCKEFRGGNSYVGCLKTSGAVMLPMRYSESNPN
jgi:hypothetical protein